MNPANSNNSNAPEVEIPWSPTARWVASVVLLFFLWVVLLGPLSNPEGSANLTRPMARTVMPIHRLLYLGHGYKFFGPDPGPGHLIRYEIKKSSGTVAGQIPDGQSHWPRLLYHRWFMLSETIWDAHASTAAPVAFQEQLREIDQQIAAMQTSVGQREAMLNLQKMRQQMIAAQEMSLSQTQVLVTRLAEHLLRKHEGDEIELFVQERLIPYPDDILGGAKLDHARFLDPPISILKLARDDLKKESLPVSSGVRDD